jgi:predicted PolB exonuclease-like 3'-5' exonuclease
MRNTVLVLDIETIPDAELYVPPEVRAGEERPFPPPWAHRPIVIGALWLDASFGFLRLGVVGHHDDEAAMLDDFSQFMEKNRPNLITWNGRGFDLPVIALRSLRHGVPLKWYYRVRDYRYRFSESGHLDLADFLSEHNAARPLSLDAAAHLVGLPGKAGGVDGSQVQGLYHAGQLAAIQNYCLSDVAQTAFLFLRFRLLTGHLDRPAYQKAAGALLDAFAADPERRLAGLLERIDRKRLLLEG